MEDWEIQGLKINAYKKAGLDKVARDLDKYTHTLLRMIEKGSNIDAILYMYGEVLQKATKIGEPIEKSINLLNEDNKTIK